MQIKVVDITGSKAIALAQAQRLYTILMLELTTQPEITALDFEGIDIALCLFFHIAIGQLYRDLPMEYVDRKLQITGMSYAIATSFYSCRESWRRSATQSSK